VQDNGIGNIRKDVVLGREILSASANQGSGIGLYLSKQLITRMGGDIFLNTSTEPGFQAQLLLKGSL
jgi:signal transduction histidine kinase